MATNQPKPLGGGAVKRITAKSTLEADVGPGAVVRKPVTTLAIVPKSKRITSLGRKAYNVLLFEAQEQGLEKDVFRVPLERIVKGTDFGSNDHELIKKHLRAMVATTVEWQSPTTGEGSFWSISGLLSHAKLLKDQGQVWVEWSYSTPMRQELLEPTVFARLRLEVISQLRSHAGIALYEICTRYKDVGRTSRQHWRWWRPVLSGQPATPKTEKLQYAIFKRDTLKPAVAEVSSVTDLEVELVEHKDGRFIADIQFQVRTKRQSALALQQRIEPVDFALVARAQEMGVDEEKLDELLEEYGDATVRTGLDALERRKATSFPAPIRDPHRYLRTILSGEADKLEKQAAELATKAVAATAEEPTKRQTRWVEEWTRRRREKMISEVASMSPERQQELTAGLLEDMESRKVHPSIGARLRKSGWQHPMVIGEMIRYYAKGAVGDAWDKPTPQELLDIASELGDT